MNLFAEIRKSSNAVVHRHCNAMRWEVDTKTARVMKLSTPGNPFYFQVRYEAMTPGGDLKLLFVDVKETNGLMVARIPFCNLSVSFSLKCFLEKWNAPREKSQQECIEEALAANYKASLTSKTFRVVAISSNHNSFGLREHVVMTRDGEAYKVCRSVAGEQWAIDTDVAVVCGPDGVPQWMRLGCELTRKMPPVPAPVLREVFENA